MSRAEDLLLVFAQDEPPPSGSGSRLGTAVIVVCGIISLPTFADIQVSLPLSLPASLSSPSGCN